MLQRWLFSFLLLFPAVLTAGAQEADTYRLEAGVGAGAMTLLSDANSKLFGSMQPMATAFLRLTPNPRHAFKIGISYGKTAGNIDGVDNFYPEQPVGTTATSRKKHQWEGTIADFYALYELHFLPYGYQRSYLGLRRLVPYLHMGLGFAYSTAGKAFSPTIPLGIGVKYKLAPRWNLGMEWKMNFTLSDQLDNLRAPLHISTTGFKKKDHYGTAFVTLSYSLSPVCPTCNKDNR